jgi:hypothetical protein
MSPRPFAFHLHPWEPQATKLCLAGRNPKSLWKRSAYVLGDTDMALWPNCSKEPPTRYRRGLAPLQGPGLRVPSRASPRRASGTRPRPPAARPALTCGRRRAVRRCKGRGAGTPPRSPSTGPGAPRSATTGARWPTARRPGLARHRPGPARWRAPGARWGWGWALPLALHTGAAGCRSAGRRAST